MKPTEMKKVKGLLAATALTTAALTRRHDAAMAAQAQAQPGGMSPGAQMPPPRAAMASPAPAGPPPTPGMRRGGKVKTPTAKKASGTAQRATAKHKTKAKPRGVGIAARGHGKGSAR